MLRRLLAVCCGFALLGAGAVAAPHSDDFSRPAVDSTWQVRNADAPNAVATARGWLRLTAGVRGLVAPWDRARAQPPWMLVEPPARDDQFTFETHMRVVGDRGEARGARAGLAMMRRDRMALWVWGVSALDHVTLWQCDLKRIGVNVLIDIDAPDDVSAGVWLQIAKDGDAYAFRHRFREDDDWVELTQWRWGRPDIGGHFSPGDYLIGLIATGGLLREHVVEFDYFDSPELGVLGVDAAGKLPLAWADLRAR